ncbi:MAG TPA: phosphoenolpyruvate carboxykinase domain-containing protein, partial [Candidatus Dormibacteraeota bacterium]|nr:phosphoenolpyruvate carboxykinase domain-containing protein [Candidatus Dormibacteraeota bacterium]
TAIGLLPPVGDGGLDTRGLQISDVAMAELLRVDAEEWKAQLPQLREHLAKFERLPAQVLAQLQALEERLG